MQLVERHVIKTTDEHFASASVLAFKSKNLYNAANYVIRQNFIFGWGYLNYNKMDQLMKSHEAYLALPAKVSQQVLMLLDKNWKSYFEALVAYNLEPEKFTGSPKIPKYKDKVLGRNVLTYTIQAISKRQLQLGIIKLSGTNIQFRTQVSPSKICQVRIVPKCDGYVIEVIYDESESTQRPYKPVASIDLGLNNLAALTSNLPGFIPLLINGRTLKSLNQFYNKRKAELQSQLKGLRQTSPRIQRLTRCRNQKVDNYLHQTSRFIINHLVRVGIGTLVIGLNAQWKREINLGKRTNQNFVNIPHTRLIEMLQYKAKLVGIKVIVHEESYTSQSSFLNLDPIPVYGEDVKSEVVFSGKRIKRGLYKTNDGRLINADVNGSYNSLRKAIPDAFSQGIESCVVRALRGSIRSK